MPLLQQNAERMLWAMDEARVETIIGLYDRNLLVGMPRSTRETDLLEILTSGEYGFEAGIADAHELLAIHLLKVQLPTTQV